MTKNSGASDYMIRLSSGENAFRGVDKPLVSEKDCKWPTFDESKIYFKYNHRDDDQ